MEYAEQYVQHMPSEIDTKKKQMTIEDLFQVSDLPFLQPSSLPDEKRNGARQIRSHRFTTVVTALLNR